MERELADTCVAAAATGRATFRPSARVLYLSYDGMCDPLGASQVLPYLFGLARNGHRITLISFEKPERGGEERAAVASACAAAGIDWRPLRYHKRPPVLSSIYDVRRMYRLAAHLHRETRFDLVHCRSYLPAIAGLKMKRRFGVPFIFDMRGFWADERIDGQIWNLANPIYRAVFDYFKRREAEFLTEADHIVSLTYAGEQILMKRRDRNLSGPPISVIPCCVDLAAFTPVTAESRAAARRELGISDHAKVAVYLGSFGTWYLVGEMMDFFRVQLEREPDAVFLFVSREPPAEILAVARSHGIPEERLVIRAASRSEVPSLTAAADYALFFIMPVFSKAASSPTKMGEFLGLELPMVTNSGVGDVEQVIEETGAGVVVRTFDDDAYRGALSALDQFSPDMDNWRRAARHWFDLGCGVESYDAIYRGVVAHTAGRMHES